MCNLTARKVLFLMVTVPEKFARWSFLQALCHLCLAFSSHWTTRIERFWMYQRRQWTSRAWFFEIGGAKGGVFRGCKFDFHRRVWEGFKRTLFFFPDMVFLIHPSSEMFSFLPHSPLVKFDDYFNAFGVLLFRLPEWFTQSKHNNILSSPVFLLVNQNSHSNTIIFRVFFDGVDEILKPLLLAVSTSIGSARSRNKLSE